MTDSIKRLTRESTSTWRVQAHLESLHRSDFPASHLHRESKQHPALHPHVSPRPGMSAGVPEQGLQDGQLMAPPSRPVEGPGAPILQGDRVKGRSMCLRVGWSE